MKDELILDMYFERSEDAIRATAEKYGGYCRAVAHNILGDARESEECVNDTYLRAWNSIPPHRPARLGLFLARITRNLAFDRFKARSAKKRTGEMCVILSELEQCIPDGAEPDQTFSARELERTVCVFVRSLSEREGNIFVRRYFFGEAVSTIAKKYGLRENNVSVILCRTRRKLKDHLEKEGYVI